MNNQETNGEATKEQVKAWQMRLVESALRDIRVSVEGELYQSATETAKWLTEILSDWNKGIIYAPESGEIEA